MDLAAEQIQLATMIDAHVNRYPESQLGDEHLLRSTYDYMDAFKRIMDSSTPVQMDYLCQQYSGLYRFGKLLESLAQGIAEGDVEVPKDH